MSATRLVSLLGLGFGDCGKGLFTDYLCRYWQAHTVVRFNGGAQAGHNVVLPDGRHHTFSQFGSGTFNSGVVTVLASPVIVHPSALLIENAYLKRVDISDGLSRMVIDARCRVTTPFHQAAGRLRELKRGVSAHGSCGVGIGETVRHGLEYPEQILCYGDLFTPIIALQKLSIIQQNLLAEFEQIGVESSNTAAQEAELSILKDASISGRWLHKLQELLTQVRPASKDCIAQRLHTSGTVLFEGAQGLLLDEWRGFHPHTTWSSISPASVEAVLEDVGQSGKVHHLGIMRTVLTRHGNGPLPTHDVKLNVLAEPHNASDGWQGVFRRGQPDGVLLDYALSNIKKLDGILLSHLDVFKSVPKLAWCNAYQASFAPNDKALCLRDSDTNHVIKLLGSATQDLAHQAALNQLLVNAMPVFDTQLITNASAYVERLEAAANMSILLGSVGPCHQDVRMFKGLDF